MCIHLKEAIALFPGTYSVISSFLHAFTCSSIRQTLLYASRVPDIGYPRERGLALTLGTWQTGCGDGGCRGGRKEAEESSQAPWLQAGAGKRAGGPLAKGPKGDIRGVAARGPLHGATASGVLSPGDSPRAGL